MICFSHFLGHANLCATSTASVNKPVIISHRHHHRLRRRYLNFAQLMMFLFPLGLDNSKLPGKAKLFAYLLFTSSMFLENLAGPTVHISGSFLSTPPRQ